MTSNSEIFDRINQAFGAQLMCIESAIGSNQRFKMAPVFLYHARRTSGLAFYYALKNAVESIYVVANISDPPSCERIETNVFGSSPAFLTELFRKKFSIVGSHAPFGMHRNFDQSFNLVTILREPYARLRSTFLSGLMRAQATPALKDFSAFLEKPENQNAAVRQICGIDDSEEVGAGHLDDALRRLDDEFDAFITTRDTNNLIRYYLAICGLPNIVMERPNQTSAAFQLDVSAYENLIREKNQYDARLYEIVRENPRLPKHRPDSDAISPATAIIRENTDFSDSVVQSVCIDTISFHRTLTENPDALEDLTKFWSTIPDPTQPSRMNRPD